MIFSRWADMAALTAKVIPIRSNESSTQETVELAFAFWLERFGLRYGSPEEDLIRAQRELCRRSTGNPGLYLVGTSRSISVDKGVVQHGAFAQ